jgi:hypothetical protein
MMEYIADSNLPIQRSPRTDGAFFKTLPGNLKGMEMAMPPPIAPSHQPIRP